MWYKFTYKLVFNRKLDNFNKPYGLSSSFFATTELLIILLELLESLQYTKSLSNQIQISPGAEPRIGLNSSYAPASSPDD